MSEVQLPKVAFDPDRVKIVDRHGRDITDLLLVQKVGMTAKVGKSLLEARLVFLKKDWRIESEDGLTDRTSILGHWYDLMDGLEPNTVVELFPRNSFRLVEITFDAVWGTLE